MNYEAEIEAESYEEAEQILIDDLRGPREIGEFDSLNAAWDDAEEVFVDEEMAISHLGQNLESSSVERLLSDFSEKIKK